MDRIKLPFEDFYSMYYSKVVQYVFRKIGNYHEAQDLASEIFTYCFSHYESYDPEKSSMSTWLYLIVNSRIKNHYRDAKSYVDLESLVGVLPAEDVDMEAGAYLEYVRKMLEHALGQLPEKHCQIIKMRFYEEKSHAEIAEKMNMSVVNVRVSLSRALKKLEVLCEDILKGEM